MDEYDNCPKCGVSWVGAEIPKEYRDLYEGTHFRQYIIGVEYGYRSPERYDGISEYRCDNCGTRWGRWTKEELIGSQIESRFGERGVVYG